MTTREQMLECVDHIEDGMKRLQVNRDMWQNDLIYWMCKAIRLLLLDRLREVRR